MATHQKNQSQCITQLDAEAVQEHAKASALKALKTGKTTGLTALGWAYYEKYKRQTR
tara:strand:+ start:359 stop:529 length:171 start_codon:yes stop_codon:yes gene_type:complete